MDINRANMATLFTGYNQAFRDAFNQTPSVYQNLYMTAPSNTAIEEFPFLEQMSGMREWLGPRQVKNVASNKLQVKNRTFEDTVAMPVNDINDDKFGLYTPIIGQMGQNAAMLPPELFIEALVGGASALWIDGAAAFVTDRVYGGATINNLTTSALSATTFNAAYLAMTSYQGHGGKTLRVRPTHLVCGPKLRTTAFHILKDEFVSDGVAATSVQLRNPNHNKVELVEAPELVGTYDDYWFLMDCSRMIKPVVYSDRQKAQLVQMNQLNDQNVFMEDKVIYGTKRRGAAAIAFPHLIYAGIVA